MIAYSLTSLRFGQFEHEDWCTHKTSLCTWNLDRRNIKEEKPDTTIEIPSCLMCIAFHPKNPAIVAGGTFNGTVVFLLLFFLIPLHEVEEGI